MNYVYLALFTIAAWIVHVVISSLYRKEFDSTNSLLFRFLHCGEIFLVTALMMALYVRFVNEQPPLITSLLTVLGTLLILDSAILLISKKLRNTFDAYHFFAAYTAVSVAVWIFLAN